MNNGKFTKGHPAWNKGLSKKRGDILTYGRPRSEKTKIKIGLSNKGISRGKGIPKSEEHRKKIGEANRKRVVSKETKRKISLALWKGGIATTEYKEKIAGRKKSELCELCGKGGRICFDHCHESGKFRGWICRRCNLVLGLVADESKLLILLSDYLKQNEKRKTN